MACQYIYILRTRSGGKLLHDQGRLRNSIKANISGFNISFSSNVPYAETHNQGGTKKHPRGTAYFKKQGETIRVSNRAAKGKKFPRAKPNDINMPQR